MKYFYLKIYKIFFKFLFISFIFFKYFLSFINSTKLLKYEIKVCICTIGKDENLYIIEFVEHYLHYGVDKIFLYDNNELNGERFNDILNDYIKIGCKKTPIEII